VGAIISASYLSGIKSAHKRVVAQTKVAVAEAVVEAGEEAVAYARRFPRFTPRTGNLQRKNQWRAVRIGNGRVLRLQNTAKYAAAIDLGARPHDIHARNKPFLHFLGKRGWVRTKRVKHPGNKPYLFLQGASQVAGRLLQQKLTVKLGRIARSF
jgi:hypothetical protein